jgi:hypothetical protein
MLNDVYERLIKMFGLYELPEPVLARNLNTLQHCAIEIGLMMFCPSSCQCFFWSVGINSGFEVSKKKEIEECLVL